MQKSGNKNNRMAKKTFFIKNIFTKVITFAKKHTFVLKLNQTDIEGFYMNMIAIKHHDRKKNHKNITFCFKTRTNGCFIYLNKSPKTLL